MERCLIHFGSSATAPTDNPRCQFSPHRFAEVSISKTHTVSYSEKGSPIARFRGFLATAPCQDQKTSTLSSTYPIPMYLHPNKTCDSFANLIYSPPGRSYQL